jgi:N-acetylmuramoyl-L-alanine amidase
MEMHIRNTNNHRFSVGWLVIVLLAALLLTGCETTATGAPRGFPGSGYFDTVVLDAGHGGHDSGGRAVSGRHEKHLALDTSKRVAKILRQAGFRVIEVRRSDYFVSLDKRVAIANRSRNAIFVSIHYNWAKRKQAAGIETFYLTPKSSRLAANIHRETLKAYRTENRGLKKRGFYVLKNNKRPAVLLELGFLSNAGENRILQNASTRQRLAEAIARGIIAERNGRNP